MAVLSIPDLNFQTDNVAEIRTFLNERGIFFDQWICDVVFDDTATTNEIIEAYQMLEKVMK